jgi:hypothetical protein
VDTACVDVGGAGHIGGRSRRAPTLTAPIRGSN